MDLLEDLNFNFVMIYIIQKILVLIKNSIFKCFFKKCNRLYFLKKYLFFFITYDIIKSLSLEEENIIKDIRNLLRLKKRAKLHCS